MLSARARQRTGDSQEMLTKVKPIKRGKQMCRRLIKRALEREGWQFQKCGSLENLQLRRMIRRQLAGE